MPCRILWLLGTFRQKPCGKVQCQACCWRVGWMPSSGYSRPMRCLFCPCVWPPNPGWRSWWLVQRRSPAGVLLPMPCAKRCRHVWSCPRSCRCFPVRWAISHSFFWPANTCRHSLPSVAGPDSGRFGRHPERPVGDSWCRYSSVRAPIRWCRPWLRPVASPCYARVTTLQSGFRRAKPCPIRARPPRYPVCFLVFPVALAAWLRPQCLAPVPQCCRPRAALGAYGNDVCPRRQPKVKGLVV